VAVAGVEENAQKLKAAMGEELTGPLTTFAKTMAAGSASVGEALKKLGVSLPSAQPSTAEKVGGAAGGLLGGAGGTALGAMIGTMILPGIGTAIGAGLGGLVGGWGGEKAGSAAGAAIQKFGDGGVVTGPTRAIIGEGGMTEAVIPLPNGKSVPLDLDIDVIKRAVAEATSVGATAMAPAMAGTTASGSGSSLDDMMQQQLSVMQEIKDTLSASRDLQQQYVYNTYN
jgi:hypothetical protein